MAQELARVCWELGQTLLPEHLISQEISQLKDTSYRFDFSGKPFYGAAAVKWNETLLAAKSVFVLSEFSYVFPSGLLIVLNENATLEPEEGNQVLFPEETDPESISQKGSVAVYVHILEEKKELPPVKFSKEVKKNMYRIVLSTTAEINLVSPPSGGELYRWIDSCKLAEFKYSKRKNWILDTSYIPPLLQIGRTPFLRDMLHDIERILQNNLENLKSSFEKKKADKTRDSFEAFLLARLYSVIQLIHNVQTEVPMHPYDILNELQQLYREMLLFQGEIPGIPLLLYKHRNIGECFNQIYRLISDMVYHDDQLYQILTFQLANGIYSVDLPADAVSCSAAFIVKAKETAEHWEPQDLPLFAARRQLIEMCAHTIPGLSLAEEESGEINRQFAFEVDCYRIKDGEEWEKVVAEKSCGYLAQSYLVGYQFYLVLERGK